MHNPELTCIKHKFRIALTAAGMNYESFAAQYNVSRQYVSQIMAGILKSNPEISLAIREFTKAQMMVIHQLSKEPV